MITKLAESITAFLIRRSYAGIREKDIVCYGMEVIISTIVGWTMILIVGAVCGNVLYSFVFGVVFLTLRSFTGEYRPVSMVSIDPSYATEGQLI
ncbi:accessory gene regulator B family protein [Murimonas intestini]|uniref:Accessory gene regulator B n=1 Tax=Murimonas intestini TaxID=1337051 RepID=A0AB73T8F3_9FIRM|nr:accessory gene regulator B family protein [Murimonas intestini]MCR1840014.1 accessory gene regulator B family protein [Murimonas intestini]MCR1866852.1 accessory gene regulator B family protein [Murimonas intestini]MCR1883685.1 accessory gene regulator B family protein [Murimonas intestini]